MDGWLLDYVCMVSFPYFAFLPEGESEAAITLIGPRWQEKSTLLTRNKGSYF